jgi:hypothetical protein
MRYDLAIIVSSWLRLDCFISKKREVEVTTKLAAVRILGSAKEVKPPPATNLLFII